MVSFLQVIVSGLLIGGLYIPIATGVSFLAGVSGIINFAHAEFVMLGGYLTYLLFLNFHLSPLVVFPFVGIAMGLLGAISYRLLLSKAVISSKESEHNQLIITLGLAIIFQNVALILFTANIRQVTTPIFPSFNLGGVFIAGNALISAIICGLFGIGLVVFMRRSRLGKIMSACRQDPNLAEYTGINVDRVNLIAFTISTTIAGAAGAFVVSTITVYPTVGLNLIITAFAIIVIGSLGNLVGAILVSLGIGVLVSLTETYLPNGGTWGYAIPFILLMLILLIRPQGLFKQGVAL
jgi:branched-chain amino acid transport system permease protein